MGKLLSCAAAALVGVVAFAVFVHSATMLVRCRLVAVLCGHGEVLADARRDICCEAHVSMRDQGVIFGRDYVFFLKYRDIVPYADIIWIYKNDPLIRGEHFKRVYARTVYGRKYVIKSRLFATVPPGIMDKASQLLEVRCPRPLIGNSRHNKDEYRRLCREA